MAKLFKINEKDNVAVALEDLAAGYSEQGVTLLSDVPFGHKILLTDLSRGDTVIKYGNPIGSVTENMKKGSYIHSHNMKTNLSESAGNYTYSGEYRKYEPNQSDLTFMGYNRTDGKVGVRNDIWIIPTVGCVNKTAERLCEIGNQLAGDGCTAVKAFTHPYGCSQMGDDQLTTQKILAALVNHPNAGGVLVVSLGCENNNLDVFKPFLGEIDHNRVKFLVTQNEEDELEKGKELLQELVSYADTFKREPIPVDKLIIGYKCGGSDAFSGITANALCGRLTDRFTEIGGSAILTEVPEMFGAEHLLMARAENENVFNGIADLIENFKNYFVSHNQTVYENPSPGNKAGGITTLEEKSLGCIQKGGSAIITGVIP
ncbi:MAG: altronate dehydratase family protein, partial [Eubacterium sp.]|nr:altronate dehydratase family protein [Eubacterium sp.]